MTWPSVIRLLWIGLACVAIAADRKSAWAADEPTASLTLREEATAVFADSSVDLHVELKTDAANVGHLIWRHTVENRTLSAGEMEIAVDRPAAFSLQIPELADGVALKTLLTLQYLEDPPKAGQARPLATLEQTLWIVDPDPFVGRKTWLKELDLSVYDPVGDTVKAFEKLEIPFKRIATLGALDRVDAGIVVIGEAIDLAKLPAVGESIYLLTRRGIPVVCLSPAKGEIPFADIDGVAPLALQFDHDAVVHRLDKHLSAAAWSDAQEAPVRQFWPVIRRGGLVLEVSNRSAGWPWIEVSYPRKTRLIFCGYPIVATWQNQATARYLFASILERLKYECPQKPESE